MVVGINLRELGVSICNFLGKGQHTDLERLYDWDETERKRLVIALQALKDEKDAQFNLCAKDKQDLVISLQMCQNSLQECNLSLLSAESRTTALEGEKAALQIALEKFNAEESEEAQAVCSAHPKIELHYAQKRFILDEYGVKKYVDFDVREFISTRSYLVKTVVANALNLYHPKNDKEMVSALWAYLMDDRGLNAKYRADDYFGTIWNEFWQFVNETIVLMKGDCEDLAIALVCLLIYAGIPAWKVRVTLGLYGTIGHAWAEYYDSDSKSWLLLEATQYHKFEDPLTTTDSHSEYKRFYAFNNKYAWVIDSSMTFGQLIERGEIEVKKMPEVWNTIVEGAKHLVGKMVTAGGVYVLYNGMPTLFGYLAAPDMNLPAMQALAIVVAYKIWADAIVPVVEEVFRAIMPLAPATAARAPYSSYMKLL